MMLLNKDVLLIIVAGLMNGSFVIPTKYVTGCSYEKIWFYHSIIGIAVIPWVILFLFVPDTLHRYLSLEHTILFFILLGGLVFGLGQVCFAYAIEHIGIALSFMINLGVGVVLGSMFVVFYQQALFSVDGYRVTLSILLIIASLLINYFVGSRSNNNTQSAQHHYHLGWLLALLTGLTSGLQNITFVTVAFYSSSLLKNVNSFWIWPLFLLAAALPMLLGFLYRARKKALRKSDNHNNVAGVLMKLKNIALITLMGLFFTGSLFLYSIGMSNLTHQKRILGWPTFMVSIILVSQTWGWVYKESKVLAMNHHRNGKIVSIFLLIIAVILLSFQF